MINLFRNYMTQHIYFIPGLIFKHEFFTRVLDMVSDGYGTNLFIWVLIRSN